MAMVQPIEIRKMDRPSTFQRNFSFNIRGESMAVMMMQKQEVDEIKIMLPYFKATTVKIRKKFKYLHAVKI